MPSQSPLANIPRDKPDLRLPFRKIFSFLLLILLACGLSVRPVYAVAYLHILSAEPNGSGATVSSQVELVFDQAIDLGSFAGSINSVAILPSQVSADGSGTVITVNPGTLIFGQTYSVIIDHSVSTPLPNPLALASDYDFSFTVDGTQPPPLPSSFHGQIHFSDNPPSTSNTVDILAPGVSGSAAVAAIILVDPNLFYQVNVRGDLPDTPTKEGGVENDLLTFLVNGRIAAKARWHAGTSVLLNLHPPQALPGGPYSGNEGSAIPFHGSANDWGNDPLTYQWDFNNDSLFEASGPDVSWTWMDNGTPTVLLKVTDAQGGEGTATVVVTVNNVAPTATFNASNVNEGSATLLSLTSPYDPSSADTAAGFLYNFNCGSGYIGWSSTSTASCPTTDKGTRSVKGEIKDKDGGVTEYTATVTINDVLPTNVSAGGPYTGVSGQAVALTGSATCIPTDYCTYAWDLDGDGIYDDATGASPSYTWFATGDHTIRLQVTDNDGNTVTSPPASVHINLTTCSIPLEVGWNLVSCDIHPADPATAVVLSGIADKYDLVYAWDPTGLIAVIGNWMKYSPSAPIYSNNLPYLNEKMGFWIEVTEACTLTISGSAPTTTDISLWDDIGGWNMVGYPSVAERTLPEALSNHGVGTTLTLMYAYHAIDTGDVWKKFNPYAYPYSNNLKTMTPGWGYWIQVTADSTWTVNYLAP